MKHKIFSIFLIVAFVSAISSCQTVPEEHKGAAVGAGVGAATGAATGAVLGKSTKAAVIGGLIGALLGGAVGHYTYDKQKTREQTAQTYNYNASQGTILTIEEATFSPRSVRPGDVLEIKMTYAVLTPSPGTTIGVTEIREITHEGQLVGRPEVRVERSDGTFSSAVPIRLPTSAKKGLYRVKVMVEAGNVKDTKEMSFTIL